MNSLISLEKVNYQIADQHILHDVDWQIPAGTHITLTGPSGGGKSTLLRIIAAMISKTSGTLIFDGQPIESYDPIMYRRQVSYCFQQPTLFGETVADNLAFPYQIRKQVMDTQRVVTALNNVGLSERTLHQPIIELSGGERQRVALIRNILFLPKVLLLDEVTAGLDENNKQIVHSWLRQLNEQDHVTTIMITHDATEIAAADQLAKVIAGRLEVHT
ncbi:ATP-binding cassette domain-containing protein [Lactococcus lactis]|uniref:ABC transporter ATP-binding protein n=1 Tax=Lactococcus lactis TaxID=1358 RepID=UPI00071E4D64|nr:ATP-binding cassette domain-containing protein [Lactococcus lactis]KST77723.1 YbbL ABC transporter ATP-binding protein [Lactococcus lactis subsp. lactis]MBU7543088.1 ATP-binding cassette domain-containing protein [Lactococcus lactis]MDU0412267.1 putative iron export ATP-binding protein FetA [Lactococcus lactis]